jgi:hypothetical protein
LWVRIKRKILGLTVWYYVVAGYGISCEWQAKTSKEHQQSPACRNMPHAANSQPWGAAAAWSCEIVELASLTVTVAVH